MRPVLILAGAMLTIAASLSCGLLLFQRLQLRLYRQEVLPYAFVTGAALFSLLVFLLTAAKLARRSHEDFLAYYKPGATRGAAEDKAALELPRPRHGRWIDVSPLDRNTSGLTVLTTDGELASRLMHPSAVVEREYAVRLLGAPSDAQLRELEEGILLDTGVAKVEKIEAGRGSGSNAWHHMTLREARHRDLRPMLAAVGLAVSRVIRVRYGAVALGELYRGASRPLAPAESKALYDLAGMAPRRKKAGASRGAA